jgi:cytochrome c biogenesis protein CcdA
MPALRAGSLLLQGDKEIRRELAGLLKAASITGGAMPSTPSPSIGSRTAAGTTMAGQGRDAISVMSVIAAGLIDGINPCAFTTLIFLLASLSLAGRGRLEVLAIGAFFSIGVFLTYLAIGLGLFGILRAASAFAPISLILRWVLVLALIALSSLSVRDWLLIRAGRSNEMLLQLPGSLKRRIHASIRTRVRTAALAGSSLVLGFLVSVFEFACTGQVYLPTLAYMVRARPGADSMALLVLYNLCFIAPLIAVFAASFLGVGSRRITTLFQSRLGLVKLALAVLFLGLAVLTIAG